MLLINTETGLEHEIGDATLEVLRRTGEIRKFARRQIKIKGAGDGNKVLVAMHRNGLGDDICSLPGVLSKCRAGFDVSVVCRAFTSPIFERVSASVFDERDYPRPLKDMLNSFGTLYNLRNWCTEHDADTQGNVYKTRFEQLAEYIEVKIPHSFSWIDLFGLSGQRRGDVVYFAPKSTSPLRSYGHRINGAVEVPIYNDIFRLASDIYHAKCVVAVDNGILHLALSLGTPVVGLFGGTDENTIVGQYAKYLTSPVKILRSNKEDSCARPCSFQSARGWLVEGKCKSTADCMTELTPGYVNAEVDKFLASLN